MIRSLLHPRAAVALLSAVFTASASAAVFSDLYIFGDSLSDTGNASIATGGTEVPDPPYYDGRISNGPVWVETLATQYLDLTAPVPFLAGGNNYATGSAQTSGPLPQSLPNQVNAFTGTFDTTDLVVVWGGSNDLASGIPDPVGSATNVLGVVDSLADKGATTLLLVNLPDLGSTPRARAQGPVVQGLATGFSVAFNTALAAGIPGLEAANPGLDIVLMDVFTLSLQIQANPAAFGFTNATDSALLTDANPAGYVYYDDLHPTTEVHDLFAQQAAALLVVPEPSGAVLALLGAAAMLPRRRRAA